MIDGTGESPEVAKPARGKERDRWELVGAKVVALEGTDMKDGGHEDGHKKLKFAMLRRLANDMETCLGSNGSLKL